MNILKRIHIRDSVLLSALFIIFLVVALTRCYNTQVIWSDTEGYYMYLPAVFIQHDIHHVPLKSMNARKNDKGEVVMKYTCGVAFFYLPFFLAAHAYACL